MADKQLAIALVGTDEASGVVGQSAKKMAADLEALQKRTFDAGHDARARELRDISSHYETITAQYKAQQERLLVYEKTAQEKLAAMRVQRAGLRATPEIAAQRGEIEQVRALIAQNQKVQAAAQEAREAEEAALASRKSAPQTPWYRRDMGFLLKERTLRHMLGGFIAAEGLRATLGIEQAHFAGQEYNVVAGNVNSRLADVVAARMGVLQARGGVLGGVPIIGQIAQTFSDLVANRPLLEKLGQSAGAASEKLNALGRISAETASRIEAGEAKLYGYTAGETAAKAAGRAGIERMGALHQAWEAVLAANTALGQATVLHVGEAQAQRMADQAGVRFMALQSLQGQEAGVEAQNVEREHTLDINRFWRGMALRRFEADRAGLSQTPAIRRAREEFGLRMKFQQEMEQFAGLGARQAALGDEAQWRKDWTERQTAERMAANPTLGATPEAEARLRQQVTEESVEALQKERQWIREQEERLEQTRSIQAGELAALKARQQLEIGDTTERARLLGLGGRALRSAQRERERGLLELELRAEEPEIAAAKRRALQEKYDVEDAQRARRHGEVMRDAEEQTTLRVEARRKRAMERIAESYADDLEKFRDNAIEKQKILDEIAAKQGALAFQQNEERRQERAGMLEAGLGVAGGPFADMGERLRLQERYRRARLEHPEMSDFLDRAQRAEEAEMIARQGWLPHEVASRRGTWDASRPSGYDNPLIGLTKEMQAFRQFLQNLIGNGGITKVLSFNG